MNPLIIGRSLEEVSVTQPSWREAVALVEVPARPEGGLWSVAVEYVTGPHKFKISAEGEWGATHERLFGPDGDGFTSEGVDRCLVTTAPRGSLIAKIGGGTADRSGTLYPVGRLSVIELPDPGGSNPVHGTLFLTMNDDPTRFREHAGSVKVRIWEAS